MSDNAPEAGTSTGNPDGGSPGSVTPEPSKTDEGTLSNGKDASWESRAKGFQSRADRLAAENTSLQERIAELEARPEEASSFSMEDVESAVRRETLRTQDLLSTREALRTKYPKVVEKFGHVFEDVSGFNSPEEMRAAVETYGDLIDSIANEAREAALAESGQQRRPSPGPPPVDTGSPTAGMPSLEEIKNWTLDDYARFEAKNPGVLDEILADHM